MMRRTLFALVVAAGFSQPVDLQVGADGGLYILSRGAGAVHVIRYGSL
jgi:hypothetical protein